MESRLVDRGPMKLVGLSFFGDPFRLHGGWDEENEIGRLWKRFLAVYQGRGHELRHVVNPEVMYEVHIEHGETAQTGELEVFCGVEVASLDETPVELVAKMLPATRYVAFTLRGAEIASDWNLAMSNWLAQSGHRRAFAYGFQRYDERFQGVEDMEHSVLEVYMPIELESPMPQPADESA